MSIYGLAENENVIHCISKHLYLNQIQWRKKEVFGLLFVSSLYMSFVNLNVFL